MPCSSLWDFPQAHDRQPERCFLIESARLSFFEARLPVCEPIHEVARNNGHKLERGFRYDRIALLYSCRSQPKLETESTRHRPSTNTESVDTNPAADTGCDSLAADFSATRTPVDFQ